MSEVLVFTLDQSGELIEDAGRVQAQVQIAPAEEHPQSPITADFSHVEVSPYLTAGVAIALGVAGIRHLLKTDIRMTQHSNEPQS